MPKDVELLYFYNQLYRASIRILELIDEGHLIDPKGIRESEINWLRTAIDGVCHYKK